MKLEDIDKPEVNSRLESAWKAYERLPDKLRYAHFSPGYAIADAMRDESARAEFFIYEDNGGIFYHAFHMREAPVDGFHDIESPYGYGGPLIHAEDPDFARRAFSRYREWCRDNRVLVEFIRFHPHLRAWEYYDGPCDYNRKTVWIDCAADNMLEGYNASVRNYSRKLSASGVRVVYPKADEFCERFIPLYYETMSRAKADPFYFFNKNYFEALAKIPGLKFILEDANGTCLGGAFGLFSGEDMEYHLVATTLEGKACNAGVVLVHEMRRQGKALGCKYMNLGGGTDCSPDNYLLRFKQHFSKKMADFYIGKYVPFPAEYEALRKKWQSSAGYSNLTIFYR